MRRDGNNTLSKTAELSVIEERRVQEMVSVYLWRGKKEPGKVLRMEGVKEKVELDMEERVSVYKPMKSKNILLEGRE